VPRRSYNSPIRAAASDKTRERIVAAAAKLLRSKGSGGFSLEAIGKAAGVTRLTVYNQFGSRRALLEAVFDDRARRGGIHRIPEAMADPDPHSGLRRIIAIFCDFWSSDKGAMARLQGIGANDAEFVTAIRERNERRRQILSVLVKRMAKSGDVQMASIKDLTDLLFILTSFPVFAELATSGRDKQAVAVLIQTVARDLIRRAAD
jgi:AcrR family transcriptional regulator